MDLTLNLIGFCSYRLAQELNEAHMVRGSHGLLERHWSDIQGPFLKVGFYVV